jgi:hypothetical protein
MTREPVFLLVSFLTSALRLPRRLLLFLSLDFVMGSKWREEASKWRETLQTHRTRIMPVSVVTVKGRTVKSVAVMLLYSAAPVVSSSTEF